MDSPCASQITPEFKAATPLLYVIVLRAGKFEDAARALELMSKHFRLGDEPLCGISPVADGPFFYQVVTPDA
jgi:hypothetical protein